MKRESITDGSWVYLVILTVLHLSASFNHRNHEYLDSFIVGKVIISLIGKVLISKCMGNLSFQIFRLEKSEF